MGDGSAMHRVIYSEAIVRDAVRAYAWRRLVVEQKGLWVVALLMLALAVYLVVSGERGWIVGVVGFAALVPFILVGAGLLAHHSNTVGRFRRMARPEAEVAVREDGITIRSDLGSGHVPWSSITEIWERPGYFMIFTERNAFNTLPAVDLPAEAMERLRMRAAGA